VVRKISSGLENADFRTIATDIRSFPESSEIVVNQESAVVVAVKPVIEVHLMQV